MGTETTALAGNFTLLTILLALSALALGATVAFVGDGVPGQRRTHG